jgi:hypothetical protein
MTDWNVAEREHRLNTSPTLRKAAYMVGYADAKASAATRRVT